MTGVQLARRPGTATLETLTLPSGPDGDAARTRYGSFFVSVTKNEFALDRIVGAPPGRP